MLARTKQEINLRIQSNGSTEEDKSSRPKFILFTSIVSNAGAKYAISSSFMIFILKTTTRGALRTTALAQTVLKRAFHIVLEAA
jgi:hypothetical protein